MIFRRHSAEYLLRVFDEPERIVGWLMARINKERAIYLEPDPVSPTLGTVTTGQEQLLTRLLADDKTVALVLSLSDKNNMGILSTRRIWNQCNKRGRSASLEELLKPRINSRVLRIDTSLNSAFLAETCRSYKDVGIGGHFRSAIKPACPLPPTKLPFAHLAIPHEPHATGRRSQLTLREKSDRVFASFSATAPFERAA